MFHRAFFARNIFIYIETGSHLDTCQYRQLALGIRVFGSVSDMNISGYIR